MNFTRIDECSLIFVACHLIYFLHLCSPRNTGSSKIPAGQMTIFYCGRVNVYDDVPADKVLKFRFHLQSTNFCS